MIDELISNSLELDYDLIRKNSLLLEMNQTILDSKKKITNKELINEIELFFTIVKTVIKQFNDLITACDSQRKTLRVILIKLLKQMHNDEKASYNDRKTNIPNNSKNSDNKSTKLKFNCSTITTETKFNILSELKEKFIEKCLVRNNKLTNQIQILNLAIYGHEVAKKSKLAATLAPTNNTAKVLFSPLRKFSKATTSLGVKTRAKGICKTQANTSMHQIWISPKNTIDIYNHRNKGSNQSNPVIKTSLNTPGNKASPFKKNIQKHNRRSKSLVDIEDVPILNCIRPFTRFDNMSVSDTHKTYLEKKGLMTDVPNLSASYNTNTNSISENKLAAGIDPYMKKLLNLDFGTEKYNMISSSPIQTPRSILNGCGTSILDTKTNLDIKNKKTTSTQSTPSSASTSNKGTVTGIGITRNKIVNIKVKQKEKGILNKHAVHHPNTPTTSNYSNHESKVYKLNKEVESIIPPKANITHETLHVNSNINQNSLNNSKEIAKVVSFSRNMANQPNRPVNLINKISFNFVDNYCSALNNSYNYNNELGSWIQTNSTQNNVKPNIGEQLEKTSFNLAENKKQIMDRLIENQNQLKGPSIRNTERSNNVTTTDNTYRSIGSRVTPPNTKKR